MPGTGPGSATASTRQRCPHRAPSRISHRRTRILPSLPSTSRNGTSMDTVSKPETVNLELDDLQGGVLHPRPSPYVGTYLLLRIDDRGAGRELLRRLHPVVERARRAHQDLPGVEVIWRQDCYQLPTGRTSFGFKDGIGQPAVEGSGIPGSNPRERPIKAGEFILGYPDEMGSLPPMPTPEVL